MGERDNVDVPKPEGDLTPGEVNVEPLDITGRPRTRVFGLVLLAKLYGMQLVVKLGINRLGLQIRESYGRRKVQARQIRVNNDLRLVVDKIDL